FASDGFTKDLGIGGSSGGTMRCIIRVVEALNSIELVCWREMRVAQRHRQRLVAQQFLNCPQVDTKHHEPTRESVAEAVAGEVLEMGPLERLRNHAIDEVLRVERRLASGAVEHPR